MMEISFEDKIALVTGSSRGIGKQIADDIESLGGEVIRTSRDNLDFTNDDSIANFLSWLTNNYDRIDILVNNAGINIVDDISYYCWKDFKQLVDVNLKGTFAISRSVSHMMKKHKYGRIVNISSIYGVVSAPMRSVYSMTKAGIIGFTRGMALDLAKYNILVNAVSPGFTATDLTVSILGEDGMLEKRKEIPLGRLASPKDISNIVLFLCSDLNQYITGQNIIVDGGYVIV